MSYIPLDEPYCTTEDLDRLEMRVQRRIFDYGYLACSVGLLLKDCPPFLNKKWRRWWRAGWRQQRGLPPELIDHLRLAPEILDPGEDPDPYGLMKTVPSDDIGK